MLCDTIKSLRKKRGLSQAQIALKLGITQGAVSQWETGATEPGADQLLALAKIFDVSVYEIKGKAEPDTKKEPAQGGRSRTEIILDSLNPENRAKAESYLEYLLTTQDKAET